MLSFEKFHMSCDSRFLYIVCSVMPPLSLTLNLLTTTIVPPPNNASKWQMGFNSVFKGMERRLRLSVRSCRVFCFLDSDRVKS